MPTNTTLESLARVRKIMDCQSTHCSSKEFHEAVNVTFHNFEAEVNDREHLPRGFNRWRVIVREVRKIMTC